MITSNKIPYTPVKRMVINDEFISDRIFDALCDLMPENLNVYFSRLTTLQEVQRWLRDEHGIYAFVEVTVYDDGGVEYESVITYLGLTEDVEDGPENWHTTYEESLEDAVFAGLEYLKENK